MYTKSIHYEKDIVMDTTVTFELYVDTDLSLQLHLTKAVDIVTSYLGSVTGIEINLGDQDQEYSVARLVTTIPIQALKDCLGELRALPAFVNQ